MKQNTTKKAFLMSLFSILLSLTMLIGSTFAWFTDTAISGANKISAGNLDLSVTYLTKDSNGNFTDHTDDSNWANLDGADSLFTTNMWEPGHTEVVYLKVENAGSLAFNYKMDVSPIYENGGINVAGESFKLSDYLVFKTTDPSETFTEYTRESARSIAGSAVKLNQESLSKSGFMLANSSTKYIALVVYMPEEIGNEANYLDGTTPPEIVLSVKFGATQKAEEHDIFGNDYDENAIDEADVYIVGPSYAYFPQVKQTAAISNTGSVITNTEGVSNVSIDNTNGTVTISSATMVEGTLDPAVIIEIPQAALQTGDSNPGIEVFKSDATASAVDAAASDNKDIAAFEISTIDLPKNISGNLIAPVTVNLYLGKGLDGVEVFHNGVKMTSGVTYDSVTGYVTIVSDSFSPFDILYNKAIARIDSTVYRSINAAIDAADGANTNITLLSNSIVDVETTPLVIPSGKNITINLNGYSLVGYCKAGTTSAMITNKGTLTIVDSSDLAKNGSGSGRLITGADPTWVWDGSDDYSGSYASNLIRNEGTLTVNSGYLYNASSGSAAYDIDNYTAGKVTINGGFLDTKKSSAIRMFFNNNGEVTINGGIIGGETSYMGLQVMGGPKTIANINGGTFGGRYSIYVGEGTNFAQSQFNITGGTFNSDVGFTESMENINISGGTYNAWCGSYGTVRIITGGTFSEDPTEYLLEGFSTIPNDIDNPTSWVVRESLETQ